MSGTHKYSFHKSERLCSKLVIDRLFSGKGRSVCAYPVRMVYMPVEKEQQKEPVTVLISVSKRKFKHAVKRNRVKRQIREAYRKNKHILLDKMQEVAYASSMTIAFLWLSDKLYYSKDVESCVRHLLVRVAESMDAVYNDKNKDHDNEQERHLEENK